MPSDRQKTIVLDPPIEHAGGKIGEIKLREPTGAEMREAERAFDAGYSPAAESGFEAKLIGSVSGLSEDVLNKLPVSVMRKARAFVCDFDLSSGKEAGTGLALDVPLPEGMIIDGVSYSALSLSEPTVGMRRRAETAVSNGSMPAASRQYQLILIAQASGVPFATIEKFPVSVLNDGQAFLMGFIAPGRTTGSA